MDRHRVQRERVGQVQQRPDPEQQAAQRSAPGAGEPRDQGGDREQVAGVLTLRLQAPVVGFHGVGPVGGQPEQAGQRGNDSKYAAQPGGGG